MKEIILKFFYILGLLTVCTSVFAEELYKCVTSQGTTYQSRPCSAKATQRTACTGSVADGFAGNCRSIEQQREQARVSEKNAYTQDLVSNKTTAVAQKSEYQRATIAFAECKQRLVALQRMARYADRPTQLVENNGQFYAARICAEDGSIYLSCNAATNMLLTQTSPTCSLKR